LWLFKNSQNETFRVVTVSLKPQRVVVVLKQPQQDISRCGVSQMPERVVVVFSAH
jgi:hypothetical protein